MENFNRHFVAHHRIRNGSKKSNNIWQCDDCKEEFELEKQFKSHWDLIHAAKNGLKSKTMSKCKLCDPKFASKRYMLVLGSGKVMCAGKTNEWQNGAPWMTTREILNDSR